MRRVILEDDWPDSPFYYPPESSYGTIEQFIENVTFWKEGVRDDGEVEVNREIWDWRHEIFPYPYEHQGCLSMDSPDCTAQSARVWMHPEAMNVNSERNQNNSYWLDINLSYRSTFRPPEEVPMFDVFTIGLDVERGCPIDPNMKVSLDTDFFVLKIRPIGCPMLPDDSPYKIPLRPQSAIQGMALMRYDLMTGFIKEFISSKSASAEEPMDYEEFMGAGRSYPEPDFWIFGGKDAFGNYSNKLWKGYFTTGVDGAEERQFLWNLQPVQVSPPGRINGVMGMTRDGDLVIFAGEGEEGYLSDLWFYRRKEVAHSWEQISLEGEVHDGRAGVANAQWGDFLYLFGGANEEGNSSRLSLLDLRTVKFHHVSNAPIARSFSSMAIYDLTGKIYIYGGSDEFGWHNDIWSFNRDTGLWKQEISDCLAGECPPPSRGSVIAHKTSSGNLVVFSADGISQQPSWKIDIPSATYWQSYDRRTGNPKAGDCNKDGLPDPGDGWNCSLYENIWHAPMGKTGCDILTSAQTCNVPPTIGGVVSSVHIPSAVSFSIRNERAYIVGDGNLWVLDITDKEMPTVIGRVTAFECFNDVVAIENYLYLASCIGLDIFDISMPDNPLRVSSVRIPTIASEIEYQGRQVYLRSPRGLYIINVEDPLNPYPEGMLNLGGWGGMLTRGLIVDKNKVHMAWGRSVITIDVSNPSAPFEIGRVPINGFILGLRGEGNIIYGYAYKGHGEEPFVLEIVEGRPPIKIGTHTVKHWVMGTEHSKGYAYRLHNFKFEIANEKL